jgi:integrase
MRRKIPTGSVFQSSYRGRDGKRHKSTTPRCRLLDLVVEDYQFNRRGSTYDTELRINKHLRPFSGQKRANDVTTTVVKKYTMERAREAEPATVNKELAFLRRVFHLGLRHEPPLVQRVPYIRMHRIDTVRTGLVEHEQYRALRDSLPSYGRIALVIAYYTGARKGEISKIRIDKINLKSKRIELPCRTTKNGSPRYLPIYGDMHAELDMSMSFTFADPKCPFLIQEQGKRVLDWEKSWRTACVVAKIDESLLFHDLRRTALTNMMEAGFSEKEAMEISGHKTRAVLDRYHIVSQRRLNQLGDRMEAHMRQKDQDQNLMGQDNGQRQNAKVQ